MNVHTFAMSCCFVSQQHCRQDAGQKCYQALMDYFMKDYYPEIKVLHTVNEFAYTPSAICISILGCTT